MPYIDLIKSVKILLVFIDGDAARDLDGVADDDFAGITRSDNRKSLLRFGNYFLWRQLQKARPFIFICKTALLFGKRNVRSVSTIPDIR